MGFFLLRCCCSQGRLGRSSSLLTPMALKAACTPPPPPPPSVALALLGGVMSLFTSVAARAQADTWESAREVRLGQHPLLSPLKGRGPTASCWVFTSIVAKAYPGLLYACTLPEGSVSVPRAAGSSVTTAISHSFSLLGLPLLLGGALREKREQLSIESCGCDCCCGKKPMPSPGP